LGILSKIEAIESLKCLYVNCSFLIVDDDDDDDVIFEGKLSSLQDLTISRRVPDIAFHNLPCLINLTLDAVNFKNQGLTLRNSSTLRYLRTINPKKLLYLCFSHITLTVLQVPVRYQSNCLTIIRNEECSFDIISIDCPYIISMGNSINDVMHEEYDSDVEVEDSD
jgi:hypothetical protein